MEASARVNTLTSLLPRGQTLPDDVFELRHRWIQRLLWVHVVGRRFEEAVVDFPAGSSVLIYTDGLVERRDVGLGEQLERLRHVVTECDGGADTVCDCALAAFPPEGSDDVALLAFQAKGASIEARQIAARPGGEAALSAAIAT